MSIHGAVYFYAGDIGKMTIKLRIERAAAFRLADMQRELTEMSGGLEGMRPGEREEDRVVEETTIEWGEKRRIKWKDPTEANSSTGRIFTYIQGDKLPQFITDQELLLSASTAGRRRTSSGTATIRMKNKRTPFDVWSRSSPIIDRPLPIDRAALLTCQQSTMYIMAYLGPTDANYEYNENEDEFVICRLSVFDSRRLVVEPRIGEQETRLRLESRHGNYNVFVRVVMDVEEDRRTIETRRRSSMEVHPAEEEWAVALNEARIPDEHTMEMTYRVKIDYGLNFALDGLIVQYKLMLPIGMSLLDGDTIEGSTPQAFSRKTEQKDLVTIWDECLEFTVLLRPRLLTRPLSSPRLLLHVVSIDAWERQYCAGYGTVLLPLAVCSDAEVVVPCWRPINANDGRAEMREFFIGQAADLENFFDVEYEHPSARAGLCTASSGTVHVVLSTTWQSGRFIVDERSLSKIRYGNLMQRIGIDFALHWRIMRALLEFEEARKELLRVRGTSARHLRMALAKA